MKRFACVFSVLTCVASAVCALVATVALTSAVAANEPTPRWKLVEREDVSDVWNGVTVGFKFLARPDAVYVGFYSYDQTMTIGRRAFDGDGWEFKKLPTKIGWDSHNYVEMTFDSDGFLHVTGNMHAVPLIYFRATKPNDISTLERVASMTGEREARVTYPNFMRDKEGRLLFTYRDGGSGNGDQIWNVYDEKTKSWSRLLDKPLFDGKGAMNAYFTRPTLGKDGFFHVAWVWRDTPDCATNHDLSYARSPDLIHWENSKGERIELPITLEKGEIVAPIPSGGGLLNPLIRLSLDQEGLPVLTYTKYDDDGNLQIWNARSEKGGWNKVQCTSWELPWRFSGGGSIRYELTFSGVSVVSPTKLSLRYELVEQKKSGVVYLDAETLKPTDPPAPTPGADAVRRPEYAQEIATELNRVESDDARLLPRSHTLSVDGDRWVFRWEAPAPNRDRPQPDGPPQPTRLRVFKFTPEGE